MNTPQNTGWFTRLLVMLATAALVVLGFFFLTVALIAGAIVATVFGARLWWALRKLRRAQPGNGTAAGGVVEGEYRVIEHESTTTTTTTTARLPPQG